MTELASRQQLWFAYLRWAIVTVPLVVLLGFASASIAPAGSANAWYAALTKPDLTPPDWVFPVAWTLLYVLMGLAIAVIIHARGARLRSAAILLFVLQLALNLCWSPIFFGLHRLMLAFDVIVAMLALGIATTVVFGRVRGSAAWLMVPYLVWISFAGVLNWRLVELNPNAEGVVPSAVSSQIIN